MTKVKDSTLTVKLEAELRDAFIAVAELEDRPASQIVRELMRNYIAERNAASAHRDFLQKKVDKAREEIRQGLGRPGSEVEAEFAKLREAWRECHETSEDG